MKYLLRISGESPFKAVVILALGWVFLTGCGNNAELGNPSLRPQANAGKSGTPIRLKADNENKGERCEAKLYEGDYDPEEDTPGYKRCSRLQKELNQAARAGDIDGIRKALEAGAHVRAGYYNEGGPLGVAITVGQVESVLLLIENGADVNVKYKWDQTPLHRAAYHNFVEIAKILIDNGADICSVLVDDKTEQKLTALDVAEKEGHRETSAMLTEAGAKKCP